MMRALFLTLAIFMSNQAHAAFEMPYTPYRMSYKSQVNHPEIGADIKSAVTV